MPQELSSLKQNPPSAVLRGLRTLVQECSEIMSTYGDYYHRPRKAGSTFGAHMRHVIEHFEEFLKGVETGEINYEARQRNKAIETSIELAQGKINKILEGIHTLNADKLDQPIMFRECAGVELPQETHQSSVSREVTYLTTHTIHHLAIIKEILRSFEVEVEANFGIAPSTLAATGKECRDPEEDQS